MKALVDFVIIVILSFFALFFGNMALRTISIVYYTEPSFKWEYTSPMFGSLTLVVFCCIMFFIFGAMASVVIERFRGHFKR